MWEHFDVHRLEKDRKLLDTLAFTNLIHLMSVISRHRQTTLSTLNLHPSALCWYHKERALVGPARGLVLCAHCKGFGQKAVLLESSWRMESKSDAYWRRIQTHKLAPLSAASFHFCTDANSMLGIAILAQVNSIVTQLGIFYKALQNREVFWPKLNKKPTHLNAV